VTQRSEEVGRTLVSNIPRGRAGTPEDIARAALFLASPDTDFITGEVLSVDGGGTGRTYLPYSRKGQAFSPSSFMSARAATP